ncbi:hypothetical protein EV361DRAFT_564145 [Lentinula raphanica]|nr:hypothetical protein EV361DRAFT_564145 [Lentinula raphanica]
MSYQTNSPSYVDQQFRSDGMFHYAHDFVIERGNFNVLHGNSMIYYYFINQVDEKPKEWLVAPNCLVNHATASKKAKKVKGTGQWILEDETYLRWKQNRDILWIEGKSGSGKTFLMTSIINNLSAGDDSSLVIYHYFDIRDNTRAKTSYRGFLLFLLLQFGARDKKIGSELKSLQLIL